ncbi:glycosyl hydrolase [Robiginitalea sp. M366]|uniref:WD40/YVTN/BNR-like repeat-containing protein n=1 Tax=Robiginitalea aestuariiviva TaxID=3036903 RepID=UPI00240D8D45|nr:exo-alpha-sialidase [Robiginitalea aestuariiviva]MDG1571270.1 glycosyl hydrolase [Robiginitalea aestuariiviva]
MKKVLLMLALSAAFAFQGNPLNAQRRKSAAPAAKADLPLQAFAFRNIGPAFLSGRIADIAIHPEDENTWYVAVGSGGVWKTENAGTTWTPLFDKEASYSTGCITLDPGNPNTVWVGTGENVGGRHVAYGDGVYRSKDGGKSWQNMGLKASEHISKILVHPDNPDVVWVAAQGPLWSKGGERGVYKTTDGGTTWKRVLGDEAWTGATDLLMDPRDPQVLYAATWDRHRTVAALMGGGPGSGIHKSTDGGETWEELTQGLPQSNLGKIGMAISPQQPDVLYAAIELDRKSGAVYRSADRGASWTKMSNTVSGGTGPHYYQELYASPHQFDRLYLMNVRVLTSEDGGKTFVQLKEQDKHSDNHALAFKMSDPDYLMLGTDAGIYESFDLAETWRYHKNLPLTQFYKVAVNNAEPFYHVFGGTQDNGSAGGPSATDEREGISNKHWYKTLFADGHQSATDPQYNNIIYAETQQGGLHRVDLTTGEPVFIQPQAREGEPHERFNWDAPILVSPHNPARLYFASYRVWKSEDRGDSWTPVSGDLTRNEERLELPIMGRQQSWDNAWDVGAMSNYNTITSLSESPLQEGLLYAGTDDGYIAVSSDGGGSWDRIPVTRLGLPARSFVNDIKADLHDVNTVYVVLDNHKEGDFNPYLFKSTDRGRTWTSLSSDLPKRTLLWRLVQDHVKKDLLFLATEFGVYTSLDGGANWQKLPGTPNMGFRDLAIQKRENDLVAASFGRGFFVLDDYSPLRAMTPEALQEEGVLFAPRTAKWYVPRSNLGNTGADFYLAKNPEFGAVFTYHLSGEFTTAKQARKKAEKAPNDRGADIPFPGYEAIDAENQEQPAQVWITVRDSRGNVIRHLKEKAAKGTHRLAWDLRHASTSAIDPDRAGRGGGWTGRGPMATPGTYTATMALEKDGQVTPLGEEVRFQVKPIHDGVLHGMDFDSYNAYREELAGLQRRLEVMRDRFDQAEAALNGFKMALDRTPGPTAALAADVVALEDAIREVNLRMEGSPAREEIGERNPPSVQSHFSVAFRGLSTTYGPTTLHRQNLALAGKMLTALEPDVDRIAGQLVPALSAKFKAAGAPYIKGED